MTRGRPLLYPHPSAPMLPFKLVYSDGYYLPIGDHVFPAEKFRLIRNRLLQEKLAGP